MKEKMCNLNYNVDKFMLKRYNEVVWPIIINLIIVNNCFIIYFKNYVYHLGISNWRNSIRILLTVHYFWSKSAEKTEETGATLGGSGLAIAESAEVADHESTEEKVPKVNVKNDVTREEAETIADNG